MHQALVQSVTECALEKTSVTRRWIQMKQEVGCSNLLCYNQVAALSLNFFMKEPNVFVVSEQIGYSQ